MILAIDTSTEWMGLAMADRELVWYEKIWHTKRRHTVELAPAIQSMLEDTGTNPQSLIAIAVALGPGSFTSLRIGLAFAKGLSLSLSIPIIGVPTLDITARGQPPSEMPMLCVLKSGRARLAIMEYHHMQNRWLAVSDLYTATAQEIEEQITSPTIIRGEIDAHDRQLLKRRWRNALVSDPSENIRRPSLLAAIASDKLTEHGENHTFSVDPIYIQTLSHSES